MEIDKETNLTYLNIVIDDTKEYIEKLRKQAKEDDQNYGIGEGEPKKLSIREEGHSQEISEIYFEDGKIYFSGEMISTSGKSYVCFELPLSQGIIFDILGESIKKFNKIKTVIEATK